MLAYQFLNKEISFQIHNFFGITKISPFLKLYAVRNDTLISTLMIHNILSICVVEGDKMFVNTFEIKKYFKHKTRRLWN